MRGRGWGDMDNDQGKEKARVSAESVMALVEMGFDEAVAIKALEATNDDVALAIEVLT
jgi:NACalpha-BTF3-like transcription factor